MRVSRHLMTTLIIVVIRHVIKAVLCMWVGIDLVMKIGMVTSETLTATLSRNSDVFNTAVSIDRVSSR